MRRFYYGNRKDWGKSTGATYVVMRVTVTKVGSGILTCYGQDMEKLQ
jgi:hypothetical protein